MIETKDGVNIVYARTREDWRKWLEKNHQLEKSVWLVIYHKDSNAPSINYEDAIEEAVSFGWIDSKPNIRDKESYYLFFAKRKPNSKWSKANRERAEKMTRL